MKMEVKKQITKSIFLPTIFYQLLNLIPANFTLEMKCLRKSFGVTGLNKLRNGDIRNRIHITSCIDYVEKQQIQYFRQLVRMEHS